MLRGLLPESRIPAAVVQQRTPIRDAAADDQPDEHRVVARGNHGLFLTLDVREHAVEDCDPLFVQVEADPAETIRLVAGEAARQRFLIGREDVQHEILCAFQSGVHLVVAPIDNSENIRVLVKELHSVTRAV